MAGREAVKRTIQQVRPILSIDKEEARKRVLNLYKAWYRQIPYIGKFLFKLFKKRNYYVTYFSTKDSILLKQFFIIIIFTNK